MVAFLILAAAAQALQATPSACWLVTPGNDAVGFQLLTGARPDGQVTFSPTRGSIWPARTLAATTAANGNRFALEGDEGFTLKLEPAEQSPDRYIATLSRRGAQGSEVPIAFGFCDRSQEASAGQAGDAAPAQADIAAAARAFDPARWPEDRCGMILSDGRRMPFRFQLSGPNQVAMVSSSLWNRQPVTARMRGATSFSGRNGLSGAREFIILEREAMGADLIRFRNLGDPSAAGLTAYAICGYSQVVRRPVRS